MTQISYDVKDKKRKGISEWTNLIPNHKVQTMSLTATLQTPPNQDTTQTNVEKLSDISPEEEQLATQEANQPVRSGPTPNRNAKHYLRRVAQRVTLVQWDKIVKRAMLDAQEGNDRARTWITNLLLQIPPKESKALGLVNPRYTATKLVERVITLAPEPPKSNP